MAIIVKSTENQISKFLVLSNFTGFLFFVPNILYGIVVLFYLCRRKAMLKVVKFSEIFVTGCESKTDIRTFLDLLGDGFYLRTSFY